MKIPEQALKAAVAATLEVRISDLVAKHIRSLLSDEKFKTEFERMVKKEIDTRLPSLLKEFVKRLEVY